MRCVILFQSIHQVMKAEKLLKGRGIRIDLIPVPREISSDCGIAIELPWEATEEALRLLDEGGVSAVEYYCRDGSGRFEPKGMPIP